jgi:hypothetical protein
MKFGLGEKSFDFGEVLSIFGVSILGRTFFTAKS